jgi:hypothetical protein
VEGFCPYIVRENLKEKNIDRQLTEKVLVKIGINPFDVY